VRKKLVASSSSLQLQSSNKKTAASSQILWHKCVAQPRWRLPGFGKNLAELLGLHGIMSPSTEEHPAPGLLWTAESFGAEVLLKVQFKLDLSVSALDSSKRLSTVSRCQRKLLADGSEAAGTPATACRPDNWVHRPTNTNSCQSANRAWI
jgi:hypothetical protein